MLYLLPASAADLTWEFDPALQKIHSLIFNLQTSQARALLGKVPTSPGNDLYKIYLQSLSETVDILITEDDVAFKSIESNLKSRLDALEKMPETASTLFLQAEINLQLGFNYLNLGQEVNAVFAIRRASNMAHNCLDKYPSFVPVKKTMGVIEVMVGSVPEKYKWFMGLLGMKGSVAAGQHMLEELKSSRSSLNFEATILFYTIKGFISQEFSTAAEGLKEYLTKDPENRLLMFLAVNMLIKNSQSEEAYKIFQQMDIQRGGLPMYYAEYLKGEVLLERGDYAAAIEAYETFIKGYRSQSFKKDSYYKISLCYWLLNKPELAKANFEIAKKTGKETAEPDKYAAKQLEENGFPNAKILKIRFYTDGGYYKEAKDMLQSIGPADLTSAKEKTEYYYRKARLAHKTNDLPSAKLFYHQTITMTADHPWYFAPNSALQLGYIAFQQKDNVSAKKYFEQALSYKKHEYKNSIDSKAKAALEKIP